MGTSPGESAEDVLAASRALFAVMMHALAPTLESIRLEDFQTLAALVTRGGLDRRELSHITGASALAVDESLRRLSATGRVDAKDSVCTVTPRGRALVDEVTERHRTEIAHVLGALSVREREQVVAGLSLLAARAGEPSPEDLMGLGI